MSFILQEDSFIQQGGVFNRLDKRLLYRENAPANPVESGHACIDRHALNEACSRFVPAANTHLLQV